MADTPQYLMQRTIDDRTKEPIGIIRAYNKYLADRADMTPYDGPMVPGGRIVLGPAPVKKVAEAPPAEGTTNSEPSSVKDEVVLADPLPADTRIDLAATEDEPAAETEEDVDVKPSFTPEQKMAALVAEIGRLNPKDKEHFTEAGIPRIDPLILALGVDVEGKERDEAWKIFQARKKGK